MSDEDDDDILFFDSEGSDDEVGDPSNPMDQEMMMNSLSGLQYYYDEDPGITPGITPSPQIDQKMPKPRDPFDLDTDEEEEFGDEEMEECYNLLKEKFVKLLSTYNNIRFEADEYIERLQELQIRKREFKENVMTLSELRSSLLENRENSRIEIMKSVIRGRTGQVFIPMKEIAREKTFDERMKEVDFFRRNREVTALRARLLSDYTKVHSEAKVKIAVFRKRFGEEKRKNDVVREEIIMLRDMSEAKQKELMNCKSSIESLKEGIRLMKEQVMSSRGTKHKEEKKEKKPKKKHMNFKMKLKEKKIQEVRMMLEIQREMKKASIERDKNRRYVLEIKKNQNRKLSQHMRKRRTREREMRRRRRRRMMGLGKVLEGGKLDWDGQVLSKGKKKVSNGFFVNNNKEGSSEFFDCLEELKNDHVKIKEVVERNEVVKTIDVVGEGIRERIKSARESTFRT